MIAFISLLLFPFLINSISKEKHNINKIDRTNILDKSISSSSETESSNPETLTPTTLAPAPTSSPLPTQSPIPDRSKVPTLGAIIGTCIASIIIMTATTSYFCFKKTKLEPEQEGSFSTAAQILLDKKYEPV